MKRFLTFIIITAMVSLTGCKAKSELVGLAVADIESDDEEAAAEHLQQAADAGEDEQLIARAAGILAMKQGDYVEAVKQFEKAVSLAEGNVTELEFDISYYLMSAQQKAGLYDDSIQTCSAIIGLKPKDPELYFIRGELNLEKGNYDDSIRDFNRAVDNCGEDPDMYIRIYEYLAGKGFDEAAQNYLDSARSLSGKFTDFQKGRLAFCAGDYELARDYLEKARMSEEEGVILYLGRTYEALGDMSFAESLYSTYVEKHPEDGAVYNQLGLCRIEMEEYEKALEAFEKGIESGSASVRQALLFNRVTACERMGDVEKAKKLIKEYVKEYPSDADGNREERFLTQWDRFGDNN